MSHVEVVQPDDNILRFIGWKEGAAVFNKTFSAGNKDFTCKSGFIEFVGDQVCDTGNGIMACGTPEAHLIKSEDGSLILKTNSRGFGLVYLIPAIVSEWHWYRFPPYQPGALE